MPASDAERLRYIAGMARSYMAQCLKRMKNSLHFIMGLPMSQRFYKLEETEQKKVFKYSVSGDAGSMG